MSTDTAPLSPERRKALFGINAGIALAHIGNFIWFPILVAAIGGGEGGLWAGLIMCMTYVGRLLATFTYEGVADRLGMRGVVFAGAALEGTSLLLMGFSTGVIMYVVLAFFVGFGSGTVFPGLKNVLITYPEDHRAKAFSTFQMSAQLGLFGGAAVGGLLLGVDLKILFTTVFAIFIGFCLSASSFIPKNGFDPAPEKEEKAPLFDLGVVRGIEVKGAVRYFLLSSVFWFLMMSFVVGIPLHMQEHIPDFAPSAPFWITGLTILVLQYPLFKFLNDRLPPHLVMAIGLAGMAAAFLSFGAGQTLVWVIAGCFVVTLGEILFTPAFDIWVSKKVPEEKLTKAMGAMHFFRSAGNMAGAFGAGLLFDLALRTGIDGANWYVVAAIALVCLGITVASTEKSAEKTPETAAA
ncbi:MFS transporter [Salininema proteolyticum]|uniref:MFS transporter n=1 Tax=Salininema proteolyticum TaxID=1607685 RepID=A0ABV8TUD9_9ACTN